MDILFLLIPLSAVLGFAIVGVFAWALEAGQFDDLEHEGARILDRADGVDHDQAPTDGAYRESARPQTP